MKGAIAEPLANTSNTPNKTRVITIGASQYFLFSLMNCQSSLITCTFDIATPLMLLLATPGHATPKRFNLMDISYYLKAAVVLENITF